MGSDRIQPTELRFSQEFLWN